MGSILLNNDIYIYINIILDNKEISVFVLMDKVKQIQQRGGGGGPGRATPNNSKPNIPRPPPIRNHSDAKERSVSQD